VSETVTSVVELCVGLLCVWLGWFTAQRRGLARFIGILIVLAGLAAVVHAALSFV
jgi:hypothetical protein